jgi:response regulator RpfG family c-di-GMP phosphodiesterase
MDGWTAVSRLRENGYRGPIVALTASAMAADRAMCLQVGCTKHLSKPISREALLREVRQLLNSPLRTQTQKTHNRLSRDDADNDEVFEKFRSRLVQQMPFEMYELNDALQRGDLRTVSRMAHRFGGAAGMFRFDQVWRQSSVVEAAILDHASMETIATHVAKLRSLAREVPGYVRANEMGSCSHG